VRQFSDFAWLTGQLADGAEIAELIDNHVLDMVANDQLYRIENLLINSYDHLLDVRGTKRNKTAIEIADIKQLSHFVRFLTEVDKYKVGCAHSDADLIQKKTLLRFVVNYFTFLFCSF